MGRKKKKKNQNRILGIVILIIAVLVYAKMTVLKDFNPLTDLNINLENPFKKDIEVSERSVAEDFSESETDTLKEEEVFVDIFFTKVSSGKDVYMAASRKKPKGYKGSDVEFAVKSLLKGTTKYEKEKGVYSEIPSSTRLVWYKESPSKIIINLSDDFEFGGGGDSLYKRMYQLIKTVNHNTRKPVYLYINGKQADIIGGEGLMLKQPLRSNSLEE
ncbi:GerMN domain-containing protein [bacterium]|nr:GerMN domain-containing protein [bacterium]